MVNVDRFEDALTELAKDRTVGHAGDHYAYMAGYLFGLVREMARESDLAERILVRSLHSTEQMLFKSNEMREALRKIDRKDTYNEDSYGPFAEIARAALEEKE